MRILFNASRGPALFVKVYVEICQVVSQTRAYRKETFRRVRFLEIANLSGVHGIAFSTDNPYLRTSAGEEAHRRHGTPREESRSVRDNILR